MNGTIRKRVPNAPDAEGKENDPTAVRPEVSLRERMKHFTWAWFNFPLSTGGIALLLAETPHRFPGLTTIGKIFYIFDLVVFCCVVAGICTRFALWRGAPGGGAFGALRRSLDHPSEALFFPTALLNLVDIFAAGSAYGAPSSGPWLTVALRVLFWLYVAITYPAAVLQYYHLFTAKPSRLTIQSMTPSWILPVFPAMLCGTFASAIAADQPTHARVPIIMAGITLQGLGWMVSFLMFAAYLHRLIEFGLPAPNLRPGMFISIGPPSFTALALIGMAEALPPEAAFFQRHPTAIENGQVLAASIAVFLWALSSWFFCISLLSVLRGVKRMSFHLVWWAFVFPNVGFTIATIRIGEQFESAGILWVGSAMTILLIATWMFVFVSHVRAVLKRQILMPGKDEDKDQHIDQENNNNNNNNNKRHGVTVPPEEGRD